MGRATCKPFYSIIIFISKKAFNNNYKNKRIIKAAIPYEDIGRSYRITVFSIKLSLTAKNTLFAI